VASRISDVRLLQRQHALPELTRRDHARGLEVPQAVELRLRELEVLLVDRGPELEPFRHEVPAVHQRRVHAVVGPSPGHADLLPVQGQALQVDHAFPVRQPGREERLFAHGPRGRLLLHLLELRADHGHPKLGQSQLGIHPGQADLLLPALPWPPRRPVAHRTTRRERLAPVLC
jgi:hypothetical protein